MQICLEHKKDVSHIHETFLCTCEDEGISREMKSPFLFQASDSLPAVATFTTTTSRRRSWNGE